MKKIYEGHEKNSKNRVSKLYLGLNMSVQSNLDYPDFFSGPVFFMNINDLRC